MINGRLKQKLESAGGYFICLQFLALWFPWCCTGMLANLRDIFPNNEAGNLALMLVWSLFLTMVYLCTRLIARRCLPITKIPVLLLSIQITGDLFTEMVSASTKHAQKHSDSTLSQ